ncbi:Nn.00g112020.m01.CDS01 [Neocucurbitaria sp. VM-36]
MITPKNPIAGARPQPASRKDKTSETASHTSKSQVNPSQNDFARSHITNWSPPYPVTPEKEAIRSLKAEWKGQSSKAPVYDGYTSRRKLLIVDLHDFDIYRCPNSGNKGRASELTSLHYLEVPSPKNLCLDGLLCIGSTEYYVQTVAIQDSSIEGFGDEEAGIVAYVQSESASRDSGYDIWYRLNKPSPDYKKFHEPFLWVAQLAKHVIDYIEAQPAGSVGLESFRLHFHRWLVAQFSRSQSQEFRRWHQSFRGQVDFRVGINAYIDYVHQQAFNLPNSKQLLAHPLWSECMAAGLAIIKPQEQIVEHTLATPDVYDSFKDMYFGNNIRKMDASEHVKAEQELRKAQLGFARSHPVSPSAQSPSLPPCQPYGESPVRVGHIIALDPDETDRRLWKNANCEWLAYVQRAEFLNNGTQLLSVLWLYRPRDTNMIEAKYPFDNELFLSDNCNCSEGQLLSTDVKGRYSVDWSPTEIDSTKGFFIRQTYITQESAFVTLQEAHKTCSCKKRKPVPLDLYQPGDYVYITKTVRGRKILEPACIRRMDKVSSSVTIRKLLRLGRDCAELAIKAYRTDVAPNELVLTNEYEEVNASRIQRLCSVRFVSKQDVLRKQVPFPYNRGGAGDFWFLSMGIATSTGDQQLVFLAKLPSYFREGVAMTAPDQKLKGLSIFSGGGSLDRGLEEGGAVEFHTAVDLSATAIHTQRANARDPSKMQLYHGSVDDFFNGALAGRDPQLIARIGEVDFIAAGAPCPGFSALQQDFLSPQSLCNASHISTFCSFVDLYRPQYGVLENVVNMASVRTGFEDQNVLSQVVACLVSMGYQVNQYIMDAWSYGSAQQRSRVILTIAAPGLSPILQPWHTHSRPYEEVAGRSLGKLPNGERFGEREHYPTPFSHVSAGEVTSDLPSIGKGVVQTCVPYPDHRLSRPPTSKTRALLECIPKHPPGCGYKEAYYLGLIPPLLQKNKKETGKAYRRIKYAGLVPTITTDISIQDSRNGACVHWSQNRPISIMEARRTQGYPDHEPIIGDLTQQYQIVGNGVDRKVSFALGLALHQAVEENSGRLALIKTTKTEEEDVVIPSKEGALKKETTATGILSRLSQALTRGVGAFSLSSTSMLPNPMVLPVRNKRNREHATQANDEGVTPSSRDEQSGPRKRAKINGELQVGTVTVTGMSRSIGLATPRDNANVSVKTRHTRHSGLSVEFTPKKWNKKPELENRRKP